MYEEKIAAAAAALADHLTREQRDRADYEEQGRTQEFTNTELNEPTLGKRKYRCVRGYYTVLRVFFLPPEKIQYECGEGGYRCGLVETAKQ